MAKEYHVMVFYYKYYFISKGDVGLDPDGEVPIGSVGDDGLNLN